MKKVVFCEVAWMKYYAGVADDDQPRHGGKYIKENGRGGEIYNFAPHNHTCYGYVMHYGAQMHIERYDKVNENEAYIDDMTVVWVATDGDSCKIVGWYEHAKMYRLWQWKADYYLSDDQSWDYNFTANEKDCYLIPEELRTYKIGRAAKEGKGRGMGQSNVWYADSRYAQEELIPEVLSYFEKIKSECVPVYLEAAELTKSLGEVDKTYDELVEEAMGFCDKGDLLKGVQVMNLAISKNDVCEARTRKADILCNMQMYDEAVEEYKVAYRMNPEDANNMSGLMYAMFVQENSYQAIVLGEKLRKSREEHPQTWPWDSSILILTYLHENQPDKAQDILSECEKEKDKYAFEADYFENAKGMIAACRERMESF